MALNSYSKDKNAICHPPSSRFFSNGSCLETLEEQYVKANIDDGAITSLRFADGVDALAEEEQELEALVKAAQCT